MSQLLGLSLSIAVLGAIWAFLALGPLSPFVLVWAGFIAWGCFFHSGGDNKALMKTICGTVYGAIIGWIALLIIVNVAMASLGVVWPAIVVGVTVFFLVIVASVEPLSVVPANVYGYAAIVGYSLHQPSVASTTPGARHRSAPSGHAKLRQPFDPAHRFTGARRALRLCLGTARQGADRQTRECEPDRGLRTSGRTTSRRRRAPGSTAFGWRPA
jgi:hypothetical protein